MSAPARPRRTLGVVVVALLVSALALWSSSRGTWVTATWSDPLSVCWPRCGSVVATATGAETEPVLVPWALLALAAVAGVLATSGWGRRIVGVVLALAGLLALWRAASGLVPPAPEALPAAARRPGTAAGVDAAVAWPLLATAGAVLMLVAGAVVALRAATLPRLGARYEAPQVGAGTPHAPSGEAVLETAASPEPLDEDRQLWAALDEGRDPTVEPSGGVEEAPSVTDRLGRRGGQA